MPVLSSGELHCFSVAAKAIQVGDVYMFDEASLYLDIKPCLTVAHMIFQLLEHT